MSVVWYWRSTVLAQGGALRRAVAHDTSLNA
jgi:hypothetical protein